MLSNLLKPALGPFVLRVGVAAIILVKFVQIDVSMNARQHDRTNLLDQVSRP